MPYGWVSKCRIIASVASDCVRKSPTTDSDAPIASRRQSYSRARDAGGCSYDSCIASWQERQSYNVSFNLKIWFTLKLMNNSLMGPLVSQKRDVWLLIYHVSLLISRIVHWLSDTLCQSVANLSINPKKKNFRAVHWRPQSREGKVLG